VLILRQTTWGITDLYSWIPGTFPGMGSALLWDGVLHLPFPWPILILPSRQLQDGSCLRGDH
jgi:hypothetical protein